jgi:hypothetical protein
VLERWHLHQATDNVTDGFHHSNKVENRRGPTIGNLSILPYQCWKKHSNIWNFSKFYSLEGHHSVQHTQWHGNIPDMKTRGKNYWRIFEVAQHAAQLLNSIRTFGSNKNKITSFPSWNSKLWKRNKRNKIGKDFKLALSVDGIIL